MQTAEDSRAARRARLKAKRSGEARGRSGGGVIAGWMFRAGRRARSKVAVVVAR
jgi:hypothetical protein